jgi:GTP-binding protein
MNCVRWNSVPVLTISGLAATGLDRLAPAVVSLHSRWEQRQSTARLNRWLSRYVALKPHPDNKGRSVKIKFIAQVGVRPPSFELTVNRAKLVSENYIKMISSAIAEEFDLHGVPIRIHCHSPPNPYATRALGKRKVTPEESQARRKAQARREQRPGYERSKLRNQKQ